MTFSIVAIDRENKEIGFAIASCTWDAGAVGTAEADLGTICSQASGNFEFHSIFYEKLSEGLSLEEIFEEFKKDDKDIQRRQVGMISFEGKPFAFTGKETGEWSGHKIGDDYACQGNILTGGDVIEKMAETFEKSEGMLIERLYAALQAGDDAGGDIRGKMSARVIIKKKGASLDDTWLDLRVEDHDEPVQEVGRLLGVGKKVYQAFLMQQAVTQADDENKLSTLKQMEDYLSDKVDRTVVDYHSFVGDSYTEFGMKDNAIAAYRRVLSISPKLAGHFKREKENGKLPADVVDAILK